MRLLGKNLCGENKLSKFLKIIVKLIFKLHYYDKTVLVSPIIRIKLSGNKFEIFFNSN